MSRPILFLRLAATLLVLLGLARGAGGLALLIGGHSAFPEAIATDRTMRLMGAGLVLVAILAVAAAVSLFRRETRGWWLARLAIVLFIAGGMANGTMIFGRPGDSGTVVNVVAAFAIVICLYLGRPALGTRPVDV